MGEGGWRRAEDGARRAEGGGGREYLRGLVAHLIAVMATDRGDSIRLIAFLSALANLFRRQLPFRMPQRTSCAVEKKSREKNCMQGQKTQITNSTDRAPLSLKKIKTLDPFHPPPPALYVQTTQQELEHVASRSVLLLSSWRRRVCVLTRQPRFCSLISCPPCYRCSPKTLTNPQ